MSIAESHEPTSRKPLRLWPGVVAAVLLLLVRFVVPIFVAEAEIFAMIGWAVGALAHPVLVDDVLLVRNGQEMAAFRLSLAGR